MRDLTYLRRPWEVEWRECSQIADRPVWQVARPRAPLPALLAEMSAIDAASLVLETVALRRIRILLPVRVAFFRWREDRYGIALLTVFLADEDERAKSELALFLLCTPLLAFLDTRVPMYRWGDGTRVPSG